jgi:hypothetical protein
MSDLDLKRNVETELDWEPSVNAAEIGVAAKAGVVTFRATGTRRRQNEPQCVSPACEPW